MLLLGVHGAASIIHECMGYLSLCLLLCNRYNYLIYTFLALHIPTRALSRPWRVKRMVSSSIRSKLAITTTG